MGQAGNLNSRIIESLYCEALVLSDEVRAAFTLGDAPLYSPSTIEDDARIALSCEALRTTTRMMHAVAWLLNHRAFLAGELSEMQLRRFGRLGEFPGSDPARLALIDEPTTALITTTERFHARLLRIDASWRSHAEQPLSAVAKLHHRLSLSA